jgi:hypothetical protein
MGACQMANAENIACYKASSSTMSINSSLDITLS